MDRDSDDFDLLTYEQSEPDFLIDSKFYAESKDPQAAIIRTSDRIAYRRCRRKWSWYFSGRGNLRPKAEASPFWLGSGIHYALEDFHGYHHFEHPAEALQAYTRATEKCGLEMPSDIGELLDLGCGMLQYYESWLINREPLQTLWVDNEPQVEVNILIEIPKEDLLTTGCPSEVLDRYSNIYYSVTLDRVIIDNYKRLWMLEYKSAKNYAWMHLDTDPQVSAYSWAMHIKYPGYEISGCAYQQHKKRVPQTPAFLSQTKMFSTSKRQKTTYAAYSSALRNLYGNDNSKWPEPNRQFLAWLYQEETEGADTFIKRDFIERNQHQVQNEYKKILLEISEMLDPNLRIYPNPTRDCSWDCPLQLPCIHLDDGSDYNHELSTKFIQRTAEETNWRKHLILPQIPESFRI